MRTAHLLIVIAVLVIVPFLSGCPSSSPPGGDINPGDTDTSGTVPEITCSLRTNSGFTAWGPPAELALTAADEPASYAASAGLQFDFQATTLGVEQGQPVRLYFNGSEQASTSITLDEDGGGSALLINTTMPPGVTTVRLETESQDGTVASCEDTTITIQSDQCGVLLEPSADNCLTQDSDETTAGFQQSFTVTNTDGSCDTALLRYDLGGGELTTEPVALDTNGQASFSITLDGSDVVEGVSAAVTAVVSATGAPDRTGESATVTYNADNSAPWVSILTPSGTSLAYYEDEDGDTEGLQVTFSGTANGLDTSNQDSITITVDGNPMASLTPTGTEAPLSWQFVLTFTESKGYDVEVVATDDCGNSSALTQEYAVQAGPPSIEMTAPAKGDTLWAKDDGDPSTDLEYETTFSVNAVGLLPPATLLVRCGKNENGAPPPSDVGSLSVTELSNDNQYAIDAVLNVSANGTNQICLVSDGDTIETLSETVELTVALPAPLLTIITPVTKTTTNQSTLIVSGAAAHLNGVGGKGTLTNSVGTPVYTDKDLSPPILNDGFSWTVPLAATGGGTIPDGDYTITLSAVDSQGNDASDQPNSQAVLTIVLDTTAPVVSIFEPATATLSASDDSSTDPGLQTNISILVNDAGNEAGVEVCLEVNGDITVCGTIAPGSSQITFENVTLQPGSNTITATATDTAGNSSSPATIGPTWISNAPRVFITQPASGLTTALDTVDISALVETTAGVPIAGATLTLLIDGNSDNGLLGTDQGGGAYTFAGVPIPSAGAHQFVAQADNGTDTGWSAPRTITLKEDEPSIGFQTPSGGETLNKASSACAPGSVNCNLTAICTAKNVGNGSPATLTYDCGTGDTTLNGVVINNQVVFAGAVLTNNSTCTLTCAVTDLAGTPASSGPITVSVDRTAPMFTVFTKPGTSSLIFSNDEDSGTPGLQYTMAVTLTGVEAGQTVTVTVSGSGFASFPVEVTVATDIPDGTYQTLTLPQATIPQGVVTLQATTADAAANNATPLSKQISVISDEPLVRLTLPIYVTPTSCTDGGSPCGAGAVCVSGQCAIAWNLNTPRLVQVIASGIPAATQNLRICSNSPAVTGGACATTGYNQVTTATMSGTVESIFLNTMVDGLHTLIAEAKVAEGMWESTLNAPQLSDQTRQILLDSIAPEVLSINSPSDTNAPAGTLNASEQSQSGGFYLIEVTSSKDGQITLVINDSEGATQAATSNTATSFEAQLPDGAVSIHATVKDAVGNVTASPPTVVYTPIVDATPPILTFEQPTGTEPLLAGASLDIRLTSDEVGADVTLTDNGLSVGTATVASDQTVTFDHATYGILTDGTHVLTASVTDGAQNTTYANPVIVNVDTTPPSLSLDQPGAQVSLTDSDDADSNAGGYQVAVVVSTTGDATSWMAELASNCDSSFGNCNASSSVIPSTPITSPEGTEPTKFVTIPVFKSPDYLLLTATVTDAAGNKDVRSSQITITLSACSTTFVGLPASGYVSNSLCGTPGEDCSDVDISFAVSLVGACSEVTSIDLERNGLVVDSSPIVAGEASFTENFAHGSQPTDLEGKTVGGASSVSTGIQTYKVDLVDPVPLFTAKTFTNPSGPDFSSPSSGNSEVYNASHDQSSGQADLQIHLRLDVTDDGFGNGSVNQLDVNDGTATSSVSTSPALPQALSGTNTGLDLLNATLPDGSNNTVTAFVKDEAGNSAQTSFTYTSDIVAPDALTVSATVDHVRTPAVTLSWAAPSDNNDPNQSAAVYDVRYSRSPITDANFSQACDASNLLTAVALPTPSTVGTMDSYTVTGPDARDPNTTENGQDCKFVVLPSAGTVHFAARAGDAAGNWGPIGTDSTGSLALRAAKFGITGNLASSNFDTRVSTIGDINNDGFSDFLVGGNTTHGFCIFYGSNAATITDTVIDPEVAPTGTNYQCILDNVGMNPITSYAGYEAQNIGDFDGDGLQDFAVPVGKNSKGIDNEVRIYLGVNGGQIDTTPALVINGFEESVLQARFNGGGDFNGDQLADIVVGSRNNSEAFIVPGQSGLSADSPVTCDVSSASDRNLFQVVTVRMIGGSSVQFGAYQDFVGNVLTDAGSTQYDDVVIGAYGPSGGTAVDSRALIIKGRASGTGETLIQVSYNHDGSQAEDAESVLLMADSGKNNFPSDGITRSDLNDDGIVDIILEHGKNSPAQALYLFDGATIQDSVGGTVQVNASSETPVGDETYINPDGYGVLWKGATFYYCASLGNFDGDPVQSHPSVDFGCRNKSAPYGIAYIRLNTHNPDAGLPYGTYPYVDIELTDPFNPASESFGNRDVQGLTDFNGDGLIDVVVATKNSGYSVLFY